MYVAAMPLASTLLQPHPLAMVPFALMLLSIALGPIFFHHFWERHYPKFAAGLGSVSVAYYLFVLRDGGALLHAAHEYAGFMAFIGSLFIVAGGIHIGVQGEAKPWANCLFLFVGAILSNVIGTTGASMLLIRPWIRMNKYRVTAYHIVFFIFIVSNLGGCLTPIGDPPLFLGYLRGVPFWWVIQNCWQAWLLGVGWLIAIFYVYDRRNFLRAPREIRAEETASESWCFDGLPNLFFLGVILAAVFISRPLGLREGLMLSAATGSYFTTRKSIHAANDFTFEPVREVAWVFLGIFATMTPALNFLEQHAGSLGIRTEMQFFWFTGALSGLLDNAPTYLAFLATAFGLAGLNIDDPAHMAEFLATHGLRLVAISIAAVFFGAATYIGNGPNFMVKSVAQKAGVKTPDFLGYILRFSLPILAPLLLVVAILFFSRWKVF
jgi:Na+/H+ antiporter NhaD/arsenite permease-like protein